MEVGDLVCETWRDGDGQQRMKPLKKPVWRVAGWSALAVCLESLSGTTGVLANPSDLRPANENEIAEARA